MARTTFIFAFLAVAVLGLGSAALADVSVSVDQKGTSGSVSSYYTNNYGNEIVSNWFTTMPTLGPTLVYYTDANVGAVPSPGMYSPAEAAQFDAGTLALNITGGTVTVQMTTAMNPTTGYHDGSWNEWYGQGDMFLSVDNAGTVKQYALLNTMPPVLDDGGYDAARNFRTGGGAAPGDLVLLGNAGQVSYITGNGSYSGPSGYGADGVGLDSRIYANGGTVVAATAFSNGGQGTPGIGYDNQAVNWYTETWTFAASNLGSFDDIALHSAMTCGNDQIGLDSGLIVYNRANVPAPAAVLLGLLGLTGVGFLKRRMAK